MMALVAVSLCNAILPSSLQAIPFEHVIWKTIEIDERWTLTSLNLVYHKDALGAPVPPPSSSACCAIHATHRMWSGCSAEHGRDIVRYVSTHIFFVTNN